MSIPKHRFDPKRQCCPFDADSPVHDDWHPDADFFRAPVGTQSPFDPNPPKLCPDPILGTRDGWEFCADCAAIKPPGHIHGDPIEEMSRDELIALIRVLRLANVSQESIVANGKAPPVRKRARSASRVAGRVVSTKERR